MVRFHVAAVLVRIGEWFAKTGIELAGGEGYIDIQFEVSLDKPPYKLLGWVLITLSLSGLFVLVL